MDLGADVFQTFRHVTFPAVRSALLAGALLAFALSFDEIIVTTFTAGAERPDPAALDLQNLARPNQAPIVNVVAAMLIVLSVVPVWLAQRLSSDPRRAALNLRNRLANPEIVAPSPGTGRTFPIIWRPDDAQNAPHLCSRGDLALIRGGSPPPRVAAPAPRLVPASTPVGPAADAVFPEGIATDGQLLLRRQHDRRHRLPRQPSAGTTATPFLPADRTAARSRSG